MASIRGTRLVNDIKKVLGVAPANYTGAASTTTVVSLKNYNHATITILTGAWAAGTAAVTLKQGTSIAFGTNKALPLPGPIWTNTLAPAVDTLIETPVVSDTFNLSTANTVYVIEVDAETLDGTNGYDCLQVAVASPGANADFYSVEVELSGARYAGLPANQPSALLD